jgi:hypothetical protein
VRYRPPAGRRRHVTKNPLGWSQPPSGSPIPPPQGRLRVWNPGLTVRGWTTPDRGAEGFLTFPSNAPSGAPVL